MGNSESTPAQGEPSTETPLRHLGHGGDADPVTTRTPPSPIEGAKESAGGVYPVSVVINNLRPGGQALIHLRDGAAATWASEDPNDKTSKVSVEASMSGALALSSFVVNARSLSFDAYDTCEEIRVRLYVHSPDSTVFGGVDLPPSASVTIESAIDRTTVIGLSSFALACGERAEGSR